MGRPLTSGEREELGHEAYTRSLRGQSQRRISQELGIHHSTVGSLLRAQIAHRRAERKDSVNSLLDGYDQAIGEAWERLQAIPKASAAPGAAGLVNAINSLQRSKVDLLGIQPPNRSQALIHHTNAASLEKFSQAQLEQYYALLERIFPDDSGDHSGGLRPEEGTAVVVQEIGPSENGGRQYVGARSSNA